MFYSQFGEDRLLQETFGDRRHGFCIEVGANDGVTDSTTYYFEQQGWDCILVEPNPALWERIRSVRRGQLFECAASMTDGTATLYIAEGADRADGVSGLGNDGEAARRIASYGFVARPIEVPIRRLDDILNEAGPARPLDFITIDVEGHELEVLKGFSIDRWKPTIIIAEDNSRFEDRAVSRYLHRFGYVAFRRTGVNDWYAQRSDPTLVCFSGRASWHWAAFKARSRSQLKRIPGLRAIRDLFVG